MKAQNRFCIFFRLTGLLFASCIILAFCSCSKGIGVPDYFSYADGVMRVTLRGTVDGIDIRAEISADEKAADGRFARALGVEYFAPESLSGIKISRDGSGECRAILSPESRSDMLELDGELFGESGLRGLLEVADILTYNGEVSSAELCEGEVYEVRVTGDNSDLVYKIDTKRAAPLSVKGIYNGRKYDLHTVG